MNFKELHNQESPLLICNVWDVTSAKVAQELGFKAIGTSSSAVAAMLGYNDGEEMSFRELLYIVARITSSMDIPLSVDLEAGYSRDPNEIADHIIQLSKLGVVGINIEDSIIIEGRELVNSDVFSYVLKQVNSVLDEQNISTFINVRTDAFLLGRSEALRETIERAHKYKDARANGLFVPCIENVADIETVVNETNLPLNVMCMPKLPSFDTLAQLGVARISMGDFVYNKSNDLLKMELEKVLIKQSFETLF